MRSPVQSRLPLQGKSTSYRDVTPFCFTYGEIRAAIAKNGRREKIRVAIRPKMAAAALIFVTFSVRLQLISYYFLTFAPENKKHYHYGRR